GGEMETGHAPTQEEAKAAGIAATGSKKTAGLVDDVMSWEQGDMSEEDEIAFFQRLIDSGDAWKLQGAYGRNAQALIDAGKCHPAGAGGPTASKTAGEGDDSTKPAMDGTGVEKTTDPNAGGSVGQPADSETPPPDEG